MWCHSRGAAWLAWVWLLLASPILLGCGPACWLRQKVCGWAAGTDGSSGTESEGLESLMPGSSALGWSPARQIEVAKDREAMTEFVNGAAEILWQKGVRKMAFQSFGGPRPGDSAEAFQYEFDGQDLARDFWKENCPSPALEYRGGGAPLPACERSDSALTQAFFWTGKAVLEVRLYGDGDDRHALLHLLHSVLKAPAGLAGSEGSVSP